MMNRDPDEGNLTTADIVATAERPAGQRELDRDTRRSAETRADALVKDEQLAPLFQPDVANDFRSRWAAVQGSFVDDPRQAVRQGDELVAQVMKSLAETFSKERAQLEKQFEQTDKASTEDLRIALRRYHSFFERLLAL